MVNSSEKNWVYCLFIIFVVSLVYFNSFQNSFQFDDFHVLVKNPSIRDASNFWRLFKDPLLGSGIVKETSGYRPLFLASFLLNYSIAGLEVFGYHLFNFLFHIFCSILVFLITLRLLQVSYGAEAMSRKAWQWTAFFAALIFAVHPVQTESVTYITGRSSSMMSFFFLAAVLAYLKFRLTGKAFNLFLSAFSYACGLLVKETVITLPIILIVLNFFYPLEASWKKRLFSLFPHFSISLIYLIIRFYLFGSLEYGSKPIRPLFDHLITQSRAWVYALGTLVFPLNLNIDYDFAISHSILEGPVLYSLSILAAAVGILLVVSRRNRLVGFFTVWFVVTLAPTNSLIPLEDILADRWLYLPSVGYAGMTALAASWIYQTWVKANGRAGKLVFFFLLALVVELYGYATVLRNFTWTSYWTVWEDAVEKSPHKYRPRLALGLALSKVGHTEEAIREFQKAIQLNPQGGEAFLNLGYIYQSQGKTEETIQAYKKALVLSPHLSAEVHNNLSVLYFHQGNREEAKREAQRALEARPAYSRPYYILGLIHEGEGEIDQAIGSLEKAAILEPEYIKIHEALARLYLKKGWEEKSQAAQNNYQKYYELGLRLFLGD